MLEGPQVLWSLARYIAGCRSELAVVGSRGGSRGTAHKFDGRLATAHTWRTARHLTFTCKP